MRSLTNKSEFLTQREHLLFFRALNCDAKEWLWEKCEILDFSEEELVVKVGDWSPSFFGILTGCVGVSMAEEGRDVYINTLGAGQIFGEAAMFLKSPRTATVKTLEPSIILKLTRFDFLDFLAKFPRDGNKALLALMYGLLNKLRSSNEELAFERRDDTSQDDIDALVQELTGN